MINSAGLVHRVDFDQALRDPWSPPLLRAGSIRPMIFGQLTEADILGQFEALLTHRHTLPAFAPNPTLRRRLSARLSWMQRMPHAERLSPQLTRQLELTRQLHAQQFPHDLRSAVGHPAPTNPATPDIEQFRAIGTTRLVTRASLRQLADDEAPIWVHGRQIGGRWRITSPE